MPSKLHLYSPTGGPFCGRQLSNHRTARVQNAAHATVTLDHDQFLRAVETGKACRWCAVKAELVAKPLRASWRDDLEGEEGNE